MCLNFIIFYSVHASKSNDPSTDLHNTSYHMGDLGQVTQHLSLLSERRIIELLDRINERIKMISEC